jgi:hypothetical protein
MNVLQSGPHFETRAPFFSTLRFEFDSVRCALLPLLFPRLAMRLRLLRCSDRLRVGFPAAVKKGPAKTHRPQARCGTAPRTAMTLDQNQPHLTVSENALSIG